MENNFNLPSNEPTPDADQLLRQQSQDVYQKSRLRRYTVLSFFLPPVGLFIAWREKLLHLVLPSVLIAQSIVFGLTALAIFISLKPVMELLKLDTSVLSMLNFGYASMVILSIFLFVAGLSGGLYYKNKVLEEGNLHPKVTLSLLIIYSVQYIFSYVLFAYVNSLLSPSFLGQYQNLQQTQQFLTQ